MPIPFVVFHGTHEIWMQMDAIMTVPFMQIAFIGTVIPLFCLIALRFLPKDYAAAWGDRYRTPLIHISAECAVTFVLLAIFGIYALLLHLLIGAIMLITLFFHKLFDWFMKFRPNRHTTP